MRKEKVLFQLVVNRKGSESKEYIIGGKDLSFFKFNKNQKILALKKEQKKIKKFLDKEYCPSYLVAGKGQTRKINMFFQL